MLLLQSIGNIVVNVVSRGFVFNVAGGSENELG